MDALLAWIGPAVRDGLNSQLTELPGVRVFSDEFMDFGPRAKRTCYR
jgi:hypothetical protein